MNNNIVTSSGLIIDNLEHIRVRPELYIRTVPGHYIWQEVAIYDMLRHIIDNSVDEFRLGHGNTIEVSIDLCLTGVTVRDYGNGIPLDELLTLTTKCGASLRKPVGEESNRGFGLKVVNALCEEFRVKSHIDGTMREVVFEKGKLISDTTEQTTEQNGAFIEFRPDNSKFYKFIYHPHAVRQLLYDCCCFNVGLKIKYNDEVFESKNGIADFLKFRTKGKLQYEPILLKGKNIEIAFSHTWQENEQYYSFVNGHYTFHGGQHLDALEDYLAPVIGQLCSSYTHSTLRKGLTAVISLHLEKPVYCDSCRFRLGNMNMDSGVRIDKYVRSFLNETLRKRWSEGSESKGYIQNLSFDNEESDRRLFVF